MLLKKAILDSLINIQKYMFFENINYWTVIVSAVIGMAVSVLWYGPIFGKIWMKSKGFTKESLQDKKKNKSTTCTWIIEFVSLFIKAFVLAALFNSLIVVSVGGMLLVALCIWIGFSVPVKLGDFLFGDDNLTYFLISIGNELLVLAIMSIIIGIWS